MYPFSNKKKYMYKGSYNERKITVELPLARNHELTEDKNLFHWKSLTLTLWDASPLKKDIDYWLREIPLNCTW